MKNLKSVLVLDSHKIVFCGIQLLLQSINNKIQMQYCSSGQDCVTVLAGKIFDVIIMDINLHDTNTFKLVQEILKINPNQKILIYSLSSELLFGTRFFELGVKGIVEKQASNKEFIVALETIIKGDVYSSKTNLQVTDNRLTQVPSYSSVGLDEILENKSFSQSKIKSEFYVKHKGAYRSINLKDVEYFKVEGKYVKIHCGKEVFSMRTSLSKLEKKIEDRFIRVHATILVNQNQISSFNLKDQKIYLKNNDEVPLSRHYRKKLIQSIDLVKI